MNNQVLELPSFRSICLNCLAITALTWMPGCNQYAKDVQVYRQVLDGEHSAAVADYEPADSLSFPRSLQLANADNESIASSGENYIQALAEKMRQAGTFLPTLSMGSDYSLTHHRGDANTSHQFSVPMTASMTGTLANLSNLDAACLTVDQRRQLLLDERETILLQVSQAYYDVLRYEKQAEVYENSVKLQDERVREQLAKLKLGVVSPLDLAQSQADLASTQSSLTQTRTNAINGRSGLARLMGVAAVAGSLTDAFDPPAEITAIEVWREQAFAQRQDLLAAARETEAAGANVEAAIRQYYPSVTINFEYMLHHDPSSLQVWSSVLSVNLPIFSALTIEAEVRKAWSVYRQAGLSQSSTRRLVLDDVNQNYQNVINSRTKITYLKIQVEAAQRAYDLSLRSNELGSVSNIDLLTQKNNLLTAQLNLTDEQFNEKTHYLGLLRATGKLWTVLP